MEEVCSTDSCATAAAVANAGSPDGGGGVMPGLLTPLSTFVWLSPAAIGAGCSDGGGGLAGGAGSDVSIATGELFCSSSVQVLAQTF